MTLLAPTRTLLSCFFLSSIAVAQREVAELERGRGVFAFADVTAVDGAPIPVHTYVPKGLKPEAPILFVLHGMKRNAASYLETWVPLANKYDALLVCPEFASQSYPSSRGYNQGNLFDSSGGITAEELWTYSVLERLFDEVKARSRNVSSSYLLYGHSADAQFVHRLILCLPKARVSRAVAANAGWYTMPSTDIAFPYGMQSVPDADARLGSALSRSLILLLGEEDTDEDDPDLRQTPEAMAQGKHRLERGQRFMSAAESRAAASGIELAWKLRTVPGAHHSNEAVARVAAEALFTTPPSKPTKR